MNRPHEKDPFYWIIGIFVLVLVCVVGALDYDAALVTEQIVKHAASNGR